MAEADYRLMTEATGMRIAEALEDVTAMVGPPGEVSEAELTAKLADKADVIVDTASGAIASFPDGAAVPAKNITIGIEPVQDLHGYDNPWPAGGGKNLLNASASSDSSNGVTYTKNENGTYTANGTANGSSILVIGSIDLVANTQYILSGCPIGGGGTTYNVRIRDSSYDVLGYDLGNGAIITPHETKTYYYQITIISGVSVSNIVFKPMIRLASITDDTFVPYSNICPISGWTGANMVVSPTIDAQDGTTYPISWQSEAGTVYGGTLDVTTGVLTVTWGGVDLSTLLWDWYSVTVQGVVVWYCTSNGISNVIRKPSNNGETPTWTRAEIFKPLRSTSIASVYYTIGIQTSGNLVASTDTTDAKIIPTGKYIFELATNQTYQLTPTDVALLLGDNNVWADTGDSTVTYRADTKLYIQKINAPADDDMIADAQIASGKYFIVGGNLYKSTTTIPAGDTITPGTNCILTNLADALNALNT